MAGTGDQHPFWLRVNQQGTVDPASANTGLQLSAHRPLAATSGSGYASGAEVLGRISAHRTAYGYQLHRRLQYGRHRLAVGRGEKTVGCVDARLSLGSVTWSRNATPLPKISFSTDGSRPIPGIGDALALKGSLAHGWLEEDRFVQNALLHEKYLHFRIRAPDVPIPVYVGFVHHAQWGGTHPREGTAGIDPRPMAHDEPRDKKVRGHNTGVVLCRRERLSVQRLYRNLRQMRPKGHVGVRQA